MTRSRLITRFALPSSGNILRVIHSVQGTQDVTLAAQDWWHSADGVVGDDFLLELKTKIEAAYAALVFTMQVQGVNAPAGSFADGRLYCAVDSGTFQFDFANSTIDPRWLGFPLGSTLKPTSSAASFRVERVHQAGWYPQQDSAVDLPYPLHDVEPSHTTGRYLDVVDYGEFEAVELVFDHVAGIFVRPGAAIAAAAAEYNLTPGDTQAAFSRWVVDTARTAQPWRHYPDLSSFAFSGPYLFPEGNPIWSDPLAGPSFREPDGAELWTLYVPGYQAPGDA